MPNSSTPKPPFLDSTNLKIMAHYDKWFEGKKYQLVEITPMADSLDSRGVHVEYGESAHLMPQEGPFGEITLHTHPCPCGPVLIYADFDKGNEVWKHNFIQ